MNSVWRQKRHDIRMALRFWWLNRRVDYLAWKMAWTFDLGCKPTGRAQL
ncbi:MAG: hypothetical protein L0Z46_08760 [Nitrospiraceae bacterium]|nr:hypothetical protein [Nitrospiraceae bacterium]